LANVAGFGGLVAGGLECPVQRTTAAVVVGSWDGDGEKDVIGVAGVWFKVGGQLARDRVEQFVVATKPDGGLLGVAPASG
jgi:hypothetical protein